MRPKSKGAQVNHAEEVPPLPFNKSVIEVFSDYMKYLRDCAKTYIIETHGEPTWTSLEDDILFVLTHPNGWGGPQQNEMRQAAIRAGLIPNTPEAASNVTFVTEGEASLHFCLSNGLSVQGDDEVCHSSR